MRAYRHTAFTGPDGLTMVDEPMPEPGPGQILIRIRATALNYRDIAIATGAVPWPQEVGRIALSDASGEVEAIGPGVTRVAPGDAVTSTFSPTWLGGRRRDIGLYYGVELDGWLADYVDVSEEAVVRAPQHLSFEEAATMPCAALTAWAALAGVQPGDTVLTQGSGGVSLFAIQIARAKRGAGDRDHFESGEGGATPRARCRLDDRLRSRAAVGRPRSPAHRRARGRPSPRDGRGRRESPQRCAMSSARCLHASPRTTAPSSPRWATTGST